MGPQTREMFRSARRNTTNFDLRSLSYRLALPHALYSVEAKHRQTEFFLRKERKLIISCGSSHSPAHNCLLYLKLLGEVATIGRPE